METKKENTIIINEKEITMKPGTRAIIICEELTGKPFELRFHKDLLAYIYASMLTGTPDMDLGFGDYLDAMDDPQLLKQCIDIVTRRTAIDKVMQVSNTNDDGGTEPKKD